MFTNLIFLIVALMVINVSPETAQQSAYLPPAEAFEAGLALYLLLLALLFIQGKWLMKGSGTSPIPALLANSEILFFLICFHYILHAEAFYVTLSWIGSFQTIPSLISLFFYFFGLFVFHWTSEKKHWHSALKKVLFLLPFAIPFLLFTLVSDLGSLLPSTFVGKWINPEAPLLALCIGIGGTLLFLGLMLVFFPPLMQAMWGCVPLPPSPLLTRLELLCRKAHFKHAGIKVWTVMNHAITAAIIGVAPPFRYVMFTKTILKHLSADEIEAILAHEIGHSHNKHLLYYPLVIFGMVVATGLFSLFFLDSIHNFFLLKNLQYPSPIWETAASLGLLFFYVLITFVYFRLVFGFFSRNFERQADLHVFKVGASPEALIQALDHVGNLTGHSHKQPNWHHGSIEERINFLNQAIANPRLIKLHDKRVNKIRWIYAGVLLVATFILLTLSSSPA